MLNVSVTAGDPTAPASAARGCICTVFRWPRTDPTSRLVTGGLAGALPQTVLLLGQGLADAILFEQSAHTSRAPTDARADIDTPEEEPEGRP